MPIGILFWGLMILWLVLALIAAWPLGWASGAGIVLIFTLFGLLGWKVFGPVIQ